MLLVVLPWAIALLPSSLLVRARRAEGDEPVPGVVMTSAASPDARSAPPEQGEGTGLPEEQERSMISSKLFDLAYSNAWPAFIKHLDTLAVGGINEQILFVDSYGYCVSMVAALRDAPAPVWKAIIEAALRAGLDLHAILTRVSDSKYTVLHNAACSSGGDEVVTFLACLCPSALDMKDVNNETPLEVAKRFSRPSSLLAALTQVS